MTRARIKRWAASLSVTSLIALQAFAGLADAAVPMATASSEAIPAQYSAGNAAGFRGVYDYQDGSTLAKLYLTVETTGAGSVAFVSATVNGSPVAKACGTALPVVCTFRQVRLNDHIVVLAAFNPAEGATSVSADFIWSSTGSTDSDGGTSHGDTWGDGEKTASLSADPDYAGGFVIGGSTSIQNIQVVSTSNPQATGLASLPAGVAASVLDGPDATGLCVDTATVDCSDAFGEWSEVTVGDGETFTTAFKITIKYYSGKPTGFVHSYGDPVEQEYIGPCPKKNPASGAPCFTWAANTNTATIYTFHNGSYRGLS
ncbi:MAG TPA: hypothetical protein VFO73_11585 [Candidatus Limnocylindrales bacterium]|nr:hypothetical protein [Candidatus Limnocylindrales bacterium]